MKRRRGEPYYGRDEFEGQCENAGGTFVDDPANADAEIFMCDFGDHELVVHDYLHDNEHGSVILHQDEGTEWTGAKNNLRLDGNQFLLNKAGGNPGPPGPMRVDNATVTIDEHFVDAERRQRL